ncbi:MAG: hypothetical protein NVS4B10_00260 [Myxococcales bacterium]
MAFHDESSSAAPSAAGVARREDAFVEPGTRRVIEGQARVFYEGYWVKTYPVPADTLQAKKQLIEALTRRLFNHTEHGLNIPGHRLSEARRAYETETAAGRKRVKGAMYAGALFNRATNIFGRLVDLQATGVEISASNDLMRECGRCLQEALSLCRLVLHRSGEEGIDELWGEPFRAFCIPLEAFYESRSLKMAQAMRDIDRIADAMAATFTAALFPGIGPLLRDFARAARTKVETLRTDPEIFDVWADLVTAGERLASFTPVVSSGEHAQRAASFGTQLICNGRDLIFHIARARVSMPKSTGEFIERCAIYRATGAVTMVPIPLPG